MRNDDGGRGMELLGLGLASGAVLGSQIAMTRILSLKYAANQTFLVVSFAVLGLAVGAGLAHAWRERGRDLRHLPACGMVLFALSLGVLLGSFYLNLSSGQQIILVPLPFVGVGISIAALFSRRSARAGFYYAVDLTGAAAGALAAAPLLDRVSAPTGLAVFVCLGLGSAVLFACRRRWVVGIAGVLVVALVAGMTAWLQLPGRGGRLVPIYDVGPRNNIKDMLNYLRRAQQRDPDPEQWPALEESRWSAFGRTDLINDVAARRRKVLFVDGAAGSPMFAARERLDPREIRFFRNNFGPSVVLRLTPADHKRTALAIGSGGGRDVLACRIADVGHVTAVELNPDVVAIVRDQSEFNGGIYDDGPDLTVVVEEGRHFLRGSGARYDVIMLAIPVTKRGEGYGGFALSESYLFTEESIREYLDHLADHGQLIIVCHTPQEAGRLVNTFLACEAAGGIGPAAAMERIAVFGDMLITIVITPTPRPPGYWQRLERETRRLQLARPGQRLYFMPVDERPGRAGAAPPWGIGSPAVVAVARGEAAAVVHPRMSSSPFEPDMSSVTDDRPFFYFFTERLPTLVWVVLVWSGLMLALMLIWGLAGGVGAPDRDPAAGEGRAASGSEVLLWRLAMSGLGVAFMLVEVPLIQRFGFWFGRPTLALGLLLGMLLLATGIGALLAGLLIRGRLGWTWPVVGVLGSFVAVGFPAVQGAVFGGASGAFQDSLVRSVLVTAPVGLLMGVPFPMLIMAAGRRTGVSVAWLWGVNGVGSVLGSAAAIAVAMMMGYSFAMMLAGVVYVGTAGVVWVLSRRLQ